jgi:hypothetical protein
MRALNLSKLIFGFAVASSAAPVFAQATAPAAPIVSSERRGNSTCLERKALVYCGFSVAKSNGTVSQLATEKPVPDATCPERWIGFKAGTNCLAPTLSMTNYEITVKWTAGTAVDTFKAEDYSMCRAIFLPVAQSGLPITAEVALGQYAGTAKLDVNVAECFSPLSSDQDQALDDLRSIRNKFDSTLKAALEAAINTKTSQPEKK